MDAATSYTRRMSTQPPIEDINAIVNRFHAWAGAQPSSSSKDGVRELTYDEAIRLSRRRIVAKAPVPETAKPVASGAKHQRTGKSAKPRKRTTAPRHAKSAEAQGVAQTGLLAEPPTFRQVLAEKVSIEPVSSARGLQAVDRKTTALSLRISSAEQALLKKRAAEADLSVSSYLRKCVLEVEELRARLDHLLIAKEAPQQLSNHAGIADRIARFFRRIFGSRKSALAVRV